MVTWAGAWTLITCCVVSLAFYICITSFCTRKQIHRRAPPFGRLVLAVLAVTVLQQLLITVGAAKSRPFRDATSNVWAEGKPISRELHAMAAGPDGSLYVFGGDTYPSAGDNDLFKLDLDTKEWHVISPRGSVRPSARWSHGMVAVGSDLYVFGGWDSRNERRSNDLFRFSTTTLQWEQLDAQQVSGSPPSARSGLGMVAVGSDIYVFGGSTDVFRDPGEEARCAACNWPSSGCIPNSAWALLRALLLCAWSHVLELGCHAWPHQAW